MKRAELLASVETWLGRGAIDASIRIQVEESEPGKPRFVVLREGRPATERRFRGGSIACPDLRAAVALAIALAIDATILQAVMEPLPPAEPPPEPEPPPQPKPKAKPKAPPPRPKPPARMRSISVPCGTSSTLRDPACICCCVSGLSPMWLTIAVRTSLALINLPMPVPGFAVSLAMTVRSRLP